MSHSAAATARTGLRSRDGTGHVCLDWEPVDGALGYVVHRSDHYEGPFEPVAASAVGACLPPYADTRVVVGRGYWYKVAPWNACGTQPPGPETVRGCALARGAEPPIVLVRVDFADPARPRVTGDGAGCLVTATTARTPDGLDVHLANSAPDRTSGACVPLLARRVVLEVSGLAPDSRHHAHPAHGGEPVAFATARDGHARLPLTLPLSGHATVRLTGA